MPENNLAICLDWKHNRIRIFKETLYQIGSPDNICLLVNPESRTIAVKGTPYQETVTHKVNWEQLKKDQCYELYSRLFCAKIFNMRSDWDYCHSYRIYGKASKTMNIAEFCIDDAIANEEIGG